MTVVSLPEFLEARLAEDEASAKDPQARYSMHRPECDYPGDMPGVCTCDLRIRVLAEVAAKRAIMEQYESFSSRDLVGDPTRAGMVAQIGEVLIDLASVYSDHPDYDEEWAS